MSKVKEVCFPKKCSKMHIIQCNYHFSYGTEIQHHYRPGHDMDSLLVSAAAVFKVMPAKLSISERMLLRAGKTIERWRTPDGNVHQFIFNTQND